MTNQALSSTLSAFETNGVQNKASHPFGRDLQKYISHCTVKQYAPRTLRLHMKYMNAFFRFLAHTKGIESLQDITKDHVKAYADKVYTDKRIRDGKPLSASTKLGRLAALKVFFKYLVRQEEITSNPAQYLELPRVNRDRLREVLKEKEILKIIRAANGKTPISMRDRAILELLYSTGIRNSELRSIEVKDVDFEKQEIRILHGKGYFGVRQRVLPIGRVAQAYIEEYLMNARPKLVRGKDQNLLFVSQYGNKITITWLNLIVKHYARLAGISKDVWTHMIRHSCATHLLRRGADIRYVQEILGHTSLDSTRAYTKIEISDLKRVHRKTHPRERD